MWSFWAASKDKVDEESARKGNYDKDDDGDDHKYDDAEQQYTASKDKVNEESARKGVNDDTAVVLKSGSLPVRAKITNHNWLFLIAEDHQFVLMSNGWNGDINVDHNYKADIGYRRHYRQ